MTWWLQYDNFDPSKALVYESVEEMGQSMQAAVKEAEARGKEDNIVKDLNSLLGGEEWYPIFLYDFINENSKCSLNVSRENFWEVIFFEQPRENGETIKVIERISDEEIFIKNVGRQRSKTSSGAFNFYKFNSKDFILSSEYGLINVPKSSVIIETQLNITQYPANFEDFLVVAKYGIKRFPSIEEEILKFKCNNSPDFREDGITGYLRGEEPNRALDEGVDWNLFQENVYKTFHKLLMQAALEKNNLRRNEISKLEKLFNKSDFFNK